LPCITSAAYPTRPLCDFVERLWLLIDARAHSKERIAASGTIDLGINLHENELRIYDPAKPERSNRFSGAVVSGTHSRPFVIDPRELVSIIGVRFRPGGAFPFLGAPASELADAHVDLEALWGTSATDSASGSAWPKRRQTGLVCWRKLSWRICSSRWNVITPCNSRSILSGEPTLTSRFAMSHEMLA
jgi:hypothetical protein